MKQTKQIAVEMLAEGYSQEDVCEELGINPSTLWRMMEADPKFKDHVREAREIANDNVESALYQAALAGDVKAMKFYLTNRCPEKWSDTNRIQVASDTKTEYIIQFAHDTLNDAGKKATSKQHSKTKSNGT